jgi:hypothetical protein
MSLFSVHPDYIPQPSGDHNKAMLCVQVVGDSASGNTAFFSDVFPCDRSVNLAPIPKLPRLRRQLRREKLAGRFTSGPGGRLKLQLVSERNHAVWSPNSHRARAGQNETGKVKVVVPAQIQEDRRKVTARSPSTQPWMPGSLSTLTVNRPPGPLRPCCAQIPKCRFHGRWSNFGGGGGRPPTGVVLYR